MPNFDAQDSQMSSRYVVPAKRSTYTPLQQGGRAAGSVSLESQDSFVRRGKTGILYAKPDVSDSLVRKADKIIQALPIRLQNYFRAQGCQVRLARTLDEVFPSLNEGPEVVEDEGLNRSWRTIRGRASAKVLGIPEFVMNKQLTGWHTQNVPGDRLTVLRHEIGHWLPENAQFDYPEFMNCYLQDVRSLSSKQREKFSYYINPKNVEKPTTREIKEIFAEGFAAVHGGGCRNDEEMKKAFPKTTTWLREAVKDLLREV